MRSIPLVLGFLLVCGAAGADPVAPGEQLQAFSLPDQHGAEHAVDDGVRVILFAQDMDGGGLIREQLAEDDGRILDEIGGVYVADVSGMPALIRRFIAVPRMRSRPYVMLLDETGDVAARLPGEPARATIVTLDALTVTTVTHLESQEALAAALSALKPEPQAPAAPAGPDAPDSATPE